MAEQNSNIPSVHQQFNQNSQFQQSNEQYVGIRNNPLLLRVYADDQDKRKTCIFWSILLVSLLILGILSNVAIPDLYLQAKPWRLKKSNLENCNNPILNSTGYLECGNFSQTFEMGINIVGWGPSHQFGLISLVLKPYDINQKINFKTNVVFNVYGFKTVIDSASNNTVFYKTTNSYGGFQAKYQFDSDQADKVYAEDGKTIIGFKSTYAVITQLDDAPLYMNTKFTQTFNLTYIKDAYLYAQSINPQYTNYTIIVRYFFFGLSIFALVLYYIRYVKIPQESKIIQQQLIAILSVLLLMFNDPFYPLTVLKPNGVSAFFSIVFVINLIVFLVFLWIVFVDRINFQDGQIQTQQINKFKIIAVSVLWLELLISMMAYTIYQIEKTPILSPRFMRAFQVAKIIIGLTCVGLFGYIGYRIGSVCMSEDRLWRSYIFMMFSCIFIFTILVIILSNSLMPYNYSGSAIIVVYGFVNIYVYYLQMMYTITEEEVEKIQNNVMGGSVHNVDYDMITAGTIELVDVNLNDDEEVEKNPVREEEHQFQQEGVSQSEDKVQPFKFQE